MGQILTKRELEMEEVRKCLENHPLVESFAPADQAHGEEGAAQVDIIDWVVS